ncbi:MAG: MarP family serine protease [Candidatus Saccharimonadales bacterium]
MNIIDVLIILLVASAFMRGRELGFVRQFLSSVGFFVGLFIGVLLQPHVVHYAHTALSKSLFTLGTTLGCAFLLLAVGEILGIMLKGKLWRWHINPIDNALGSVLGAVTILLIVWLSSSILESFPAPNLQAALRNSAILSRLTRVLPSAPSIVANLGNLIDPNGFPQVFSGIEPGPPKNVPQPSLGEMQPAVNKDRPSVVKIEGRGCGGVVEGSGFVVGGNLIATNAHVVAGITRPRVFDSNGSHAVQVIWFDPDLDFAVLRVTDLAGSPLVFNTANQPRGTPAAVLGFPGGGAFVADPAAILDQFTANGRNIYNEGSTERDVFEISADVIPGNSGGPLIAKDGSVIGVVFAESTSYDHVGYALTSSQVVSEINQAQARNRIVSTGSCTE